MTAPALFPLADADPVGAATGWLVGHPGLTDLLAALATGEGRQVGTLNTPPFPRLRIADTNTDLRAFTGPAWQSLGIEVLGDPSWAPAGNKAALRRIAVAAAEALDEMTRRPAVGGCVFSLVTTGSLTWSPLAPGNQPRYVLNLTLSYRPAWEAS